MRTAITLVALALAAPLAAGCAAPQEEDSGDSNQADTVDLLSVKTAEMRVGLADATLETVDDRIFDSGWAFVAIDSTRRDRPSCGYELLRSSGKGVPAVLKGDVYRFDKSGISLTANADNDRFTWKLPLLNERTKAGAPKASADFFLSCTTSKPLSAKQVADLLQSGKGRDGEPSAARIVGAK
jgi:hypothetical protein